MSSLVRPASACRFCTTSSATSLAVERVVEALLDREAGELAHEVLLALDAADVGDGIGEHPLVPERLVVLERARPHVLERLACRSVDRQPPTMRCRPVFRSRAG